MTDAPMVDISIGCGTPTRESAMPQTSEPLVKVLTVSARYGAGGSVVGPKGAERLGLAFFDRLIHGAETRSLEKIVERLTKEEENQAPTGRLMASLTQLSAGFGLPQPSPDDMDPRRQLRRQVEASVARVSTGDGGVILGRAAAVVLSGHPSSFHVRLAGPSDRCLAQGMLIEGVTEDVARDHQANTDRSWTRFVTRLFDRDPSDPGLYHLMVDSTAIPLDHCVELIAAAATAFWDRVGGVR